jgi:phage terminase small subunit
MYGPIEIKDEQTGKKSPLMQTVNYIDLGESEELDTSVIQEVKQGKDGISIKLADKKWAWEQLIKYFDWLPDTWQREFANKKLDYERRKVELAEKQAGDSGADKDNVTIIDDIGSDDNGRNQYGMLC